MNINYIMTKFILGAFDINDNYILPQNATKLKEYKCVECNNKVLLKKGKVRKAHFSHLSNNNSCNYYSHPNESQIHKDCKLKLAFILKNKIPLKILEKYEIKCNHLYIKNIDYDNDDEIIVEYRDINNKYVADIAVLNNNNIKYIFEVYHTHQTVSNARPNPWFEIKTNEILNIEDMDNIQLTDVKIFNNCKECINLVKNKHKRYYKYNFKKYLNQNRECISCMGSGTYYAGSNVYMNCPSCTKNF